MKTAEDERVHVEQEGNVVRVSGALTITTATRALRDTARVFGSGRDALQFDLAGVETSDSAAIAVLLEWLRKAERAGRSLVYRNAPERLLQLARISELEHVLKLDDNAA